jgi:hypothetical protein
MKHVRILLVSSAAVVAGCLAVPGAALAAGHLSAGPVRHSAATARHSADAASGAADGFPGPAGFTLGSADTATGLPDTATALADTDDLPLKGQAVVIFVARGTSAEFVGTKLAIYLDPRGCTELPIGARVLDNLTTDPVTVYADPNCVLPSPPFAPIAPGYGQRVSEIGSFAVSR